MERYREVAGEEEEEEEDDDDDDVDEPDDTVRRSMGHGEITSSCTQRLWLLQADCMSTSRQTPVEQR